MDFIYRVEHRTSRRGMYNSEDGWEIMKEVGMTDSGEKYPCASEDSKLCKSLETKGLEAKGSTLYPGFRFGFSSIKQLKNWLYSPRLRRRLYEANFVISKYKVPIFRGDSQAVFKGKYHVDSRRIEEIELIDI